MKRMLTVLTVLLLCLSFGVTVSAEETTDFDYVLSTVELAEGEKIAAGEEFSIQLSLTAVEKLAMVEYHFRYDKTLMEPVNSTVEGFLANCVMQSSNIEPARNDAESDVYGEVWVTGMASEDQNVAEGEVITTIVFKALKDITEDSPMVGYYADGCDMAFANYNCGMVSGGIVIGENNVSDIPAEMTAPINNTVPPTTPGGTPVNGTQTPSDDGSLVMTIALITVGVLAVGVLAVLIIMAKKRRN